MPLGALPSWSSPSSSCFRWPHGARRSQPPRLGVSNKYCACPPLGVAYSARTHTEVEFGPFSCFFFYQLNKLVLLVFVAIHPGLIGRVSSTSSRFNLHGRHIFISLLVSGFFVVTALCSVDDFGS